MRLENQNSVHLRVKWLVKLADHLCKLERYEGVALAKVTAAATIATFLAKKYVRSLAFDDVEGSKSSFGFVLLIILIRGIPFPRFDLFC